MFPHIGPEFVAALMEQPAKKTERALTQPKPKRHAAVATKPSLLAFWMRLMRAVKAITIPARFLSRRGAGSSPLKSFI
jgi:hypothetical protein